MDKKSTFQVKDSAFVFKHKMVFIYSCIHTYMQVPIHPIRSPTKCLFIYLFIHYPFIYPFNHPSYQSSIHVSSTHSPDNHPSIQASVHQLTFYLTICLYIHYLSTRLPIHPFVYPCVHQFIYPLMYPYIHLPLCDVINMFGLYPWLLTQSS